MPWRARQIMSRADNHGPLIEWRCAEGNTDFFNLYDTDVPTDETPDF